MAFQYESPVTVYNGPDLGYSVKAKANPDGSFTQLMGIADEWGDAFGRLRTSDPQTLFESSFTYDTQPLQFEKVETTSGTVVHDDDTQSLTLTAATTSGSLAAIQSRSYLPYSKGKSQLVKITFTLGAAVANVRRRCGYFDALNGFFLEQDIDGLSVVRRSSSSGSLVDTHIPQGDWNRDRLDGSGPSGITLDATKPQILVIDGQWLGVGRVRMGFNIDGATIYVHEFLHANRHDVAPYTQTFSLPVRWEIESTAASAGGTFQAICCEVESEGGFSSPNGLTFSTLNPADIATTTALTHVLSIRPATEYPASSGHVNRTFIIPGDISMIIGSNASAVSVLYGSVLTGGTWTRANANSAVEYGLGQTITTPGVLHHAFFAAATAQARAEAEFSVDSQYPLSLSIAGDAPQAMTIAVQTVTGNGTARAAMDWKEIR